MTDLLALAERVEREAPSAELYYQIEWALSEYRNLGGGWREHKVTGVRERFDYGFPIPQWLTSLDAAVTLVPKHDGRPWFWRVGHSSLYRGWAHLNKVHPDNCDRSDEASAQASTPAAALTAACLRARAALEGSTDG